PGNGISSGPLAASQASAAARMVPSPPTTISRSSRWVAASARAPSTPSPPPHQTLVGATPSEFRIAARSASASTSQLPLEVLRRAPIRSPVRSTRSPSAHRTVLTVMHRLLPVKAQVSARDFVPLLVGPADGGLAEQLVGDDPLLDLAGALEDRKSVV